MERLEFAEGIGLREDCWEIVEHYLSEEKYREYIARYQSAAGQDHNEFFEEKKKNTDFSRFFLAFFCRAACDVYEQYMEKEIPEKVFWDTFTDIRYWCENCELEYGFYALHECQWFWRHIDMTIFRLGRLQYEIMTAGRDVSGGGYSVSRDDKVINIHIPQGSPLILEECEDSLRLARQWFGEENPYVCHSWLLYPGLSEILPSDSNILRFQDLFTLQQIDFEEREAEWRIFGKVQQDPAAYPEKTRLQRSAKEFLQKGGRLGAGIGIIPKR